MELTLNQNELAQAVCDASLTAIRIYNSAEQGEVTWNEALQRVGNLQIKADTLLAYRNTRRLPENDSLRVQQEDKVTLLIYQFLRGDADSIAPAFNESATQDRVQTIIIDLSQTVMLMYSEHLDNL